MKARSAKIPEVSDMELALVEVNSTLKIEDNATIRVKVLETGDKTGAIWSIYKTSPDGKEHFLLFFERDLDTLLGVINYIKEKR